MHRSIHVAAAIAGLHLLACNGQPTPADRPPPADLPSLANTAEPDFGNQIGEYVTEVFEDASGNLWFCTLSRGVARYDGTSLVYFTAADGLSGGAVTSVVEDAAGSLWFGTHEGVTVFDGTSFSTVGEERGLPAGGGGVSVDRAGRVWVHRDRVWAGADRDLFRQQGEGFAPFPVPIDKGAITDYAITAGDIRMCMEDRAGNLWFATDGYGALRFDGTSFTRFDKAAGLCSNCVNDIIEDERGHIWFLCMQAYQPAMTGDGGLCRYDGKTITRFPDLDGLHGADLYSIYSDRSGNVWIGATGTGVYRYDGREFSLFDDIERRDLTPNIGITGILQQSTGAMWFGLSGGLFRLEGGKLVNVTQDGPWQ